MNEMSQINRKPFKPLNKNALQFIAIIVMTLDHIAWLLPLQPMVSGYSHHPAAIAIHILGRIVKPIMAFFIAEGFYYTHDRKKYLFRVLLFAIIAHVPYGMQTVQFKKYGWMSLIPFATGEGILRFLNQFNVLFTYAIGILVLMINELKINKTYKFLLTLLCCVVAFPTEWSSIGPLIILSIYTNKGKPLKQILWSMFYVTCYALVYIFAMDVTYGLIQLCDILAVPLLFLYNGKKSNNVTLNKITKWSFYTYYPLHLLIISLVGIFFLY